MGWINLNFFSGNDTKKLTKIFATNADCVVIDCEDGVALNRNILAILYLKCLM